MMNLYNVALCGTSRSPENRMNTDVWHCGTCGTLNIHPIYNRLKYKNICIY